MGAVLTVIIKPGAEARRVLRFRQVPAAAKIITHNPADRFRLAWVGLILISNPPIKCYVDVGIQAQPDWFADPSFRAPPLFSAISY
jgi:hypothetical protein